MIAGVNVSRLFLVSAHPRCPGLKGRETIVVVGGGGQGTIALNTDALLITQKKTQTLSCGNSLNTGTSVALAT